MISDFEFIGALRIHTSDRSCIVCSRGGECIRPGDQYVGFLHTAQIRYTFDFAWSSGMRTAERICSGPSVLCRMRLSAISMEDFSQLDVLSSRSRPSLEGLEGLG